MERLNAVFAAGTLPAAQLLDELRKLTPELGRGVVKNYGDRISSRESAASILRGKDHFRLTTDGSLIGFATNANAEVAILELESSTVEQREEFVRAFSVLGVFIDAWIEDSDYTNWQNVSDPQRFVSAGRAIPALPLLDTGWPPPMKQKILDTMSNPGRRVFRRGYLEAIGGEMWLGREFWRRTGGHREDLDSVGLRVEDVGALTHVSANRIFSSDSAPERDVQERLRTALFPRCHEPRDLWAIV